MIEIHKCPICLKEHEIKDDTIQKTYHCNESKYTSIIHESVLKCSDEEKEKRLNVIYNFVFNKPCNAKDYPWIFIYAENEEIEKMVIEGVFQDSENQIINVYHLMKNYPEDIDLRVDKILLNLAKLNPQFFAKFSFFDIIMRSYPRLFYPDKLKHTHNILSLYSSIRELLLRLNYIKEKGVNIYNDGLSADGATELTYEAWKRIEYLKENEKNNKIFIAMSFNEKNTELPTIEQAFKDAIIAAGYTPDIIKDREHNNYIMPEIFNAIETAAGMVVDLTEDNLGAYFEAGYALGKKKEVIPCCKKKRFHKKKPHFDIVQKSIIIWETKEDLIEKLTKRIIATIK